MKKSITFHTFNRPVIGMLLTLLMIVGSISAYGQMDISKGLEAFENKNYYGAERFFTDYTKKYPKEGEGWYYLGRIHVEKEQNEEAIAFFEKAVDLNPGNSEFFTWQGINYIQLLSKVNFMQQGLYAYKAMNALEKAVELDPENIDARIWLAGYYANAPSFAGGSESKCKQQFIEVFKINPTYIPALLQYGEVLTVFGEYDAAMKSYDRIVEINPDYYQVYIAIARLTLGSGQNPGKGIQSIIKFIDEAPAEFENSKDYAWFLLGNIYEKEGKIEQAKKSYEQAIALNPDKEEYQKSLKNVL